MNDLDAIREDVSMAERSAEMARHVALDHAPALIDEVERLRALVEAQRARRILVTGSRNYVGARGVVHAFMNAERHLGAQVSEITLVHGAARGLDTSAARVAQDFGWKVEAHPANWRELGRAAGPVRNQRMVDLGADLCIAFPLPGSVGTWDCIRRASAAGIETWVVEQNANGKWEIGRWESKSE